MATKEPLCGFVLAGKLGEGSYAAVYKAYRKGTRREVVAIKCVEKASLTKPAVENLLAEIAFLKTLKNDYIVEMKDFVWDDRCVYIIMEYCGGGDLSSFIKTWRVLPEQVVRRFLQQMAAALKFLRGNNIAHMDLKPHNILLSSRQEPVLKLADFGFAQYLRLDEACTSVRGSPLYMAPEILLKSRYDARVDLWSVGVILFECIFGHAPFSSKSFQGLVLKISDPKPIQIPCSIPISSNCRDLLVRLLQRDPNNRITFEEFFSHPFVDLEHMPDKDSYGKAVGLLVAAVKQDNNGYYQEAIKLYSEALDYLIPAISYEKDTLKKEAMRAKAKEYMERAEELKKLLKPKLEKSQAKSIVNIYENCPSLQGAFRIAEAAEILEKEEKYKDALEQYELALSDLMSVLSKESKGQHCEFLRMEIDRLLKKAEYIKCYLSINGLNLEEKDTRALSLDGAIGESSSMQCSIH